MIYSAKSAILMRVVVFLQGETVPIPSLLCDPGEEYFVAQLNGEAQFDAKDVAKNTSSMSDLQKALEAHLGRPLGDNRLALVNSDGVVENIISACADLLDPEVYKTVGLMAAGSAGVGFELNAEGDLVAPRAPAGG